MSGGDSTPCNSKMYKFSYLNTFLDADVRENMTMIESSKRFARIPFIQQQSFCYNNKKSLEFSLVIANNGLNFGFNMDESIVDKTSYEP